MLIQIQEAILYLDLKHWSHVSCLTKLNCLSQVSCMSPVFLFVSSLLSVSCLFVCLKSTVRLTVTATISLLLLRRGGLGLRLHFSEMQKNSTDLIYDIEANFADPGQFSCLSPLRGMNSIFCLTDMKFSRPRRLSI